MPRLTSRGSRTSLVLMITKARGFETFAIANRQVVKGSWVSSATMHMMEVWRQKRIRLMPVVDSLAIVKKMTRLFPEGKVKQFVIAIGPTHSVSSSLIILQTVLASPLPTVHRILHSAIGEHSGRPWRRTRERCAGRRESLPLPNIRTSPLLVAVL
jgi:hypothetical protein